MPRCRDTALRMAATDDDAPADVFFSVKQRLQKCNIWLIGMDGSDKQIVGQALAKKLGYKFMDTNEIIAALLKQPVEKAIEAVGEEEFVKVERAVLDQVQAYYGTVISTGSMAPSFPENWSKFRTGLVAYCKVPPEGVKKEGLQAALADEAPLLEGMPAENQMELLLAQRELKYSQADVTVSLTGSENLEDKLLAVAEGLRVFVDDAGAADIVGARARTLLLDHRNSRGFRAGDGLHGVFSLPLAASGLAERRIFANDGTTFVAGSPNANWRSRDGII